MLKLVSLFSGCGGMDLGFKQAGFDIVFANDIDNDAVVTYRENIGEIIQKDIREIHEDEIPECDILVGGFPCQPFSSAGNRKGVADERGTLFHETIRIIKKKQPKVILFENVRGILSIKNEDGSKLIDEIERIMFEEGYYVDYKLLKASDYGVPQNRYRVIIVGIRKDLNKRFEFPKPFQADNLTLSSVLENLHPNLPNNEHWRLSPQSKEIIPFIKEGGSWKDIPYDKLPERMKRIRDNIKKYKSPNFYRRYSRNEICGTITAAATPENCGIIHPTEDRRFTVREVARIQSFPDDFVFKANNISGKYKVIGNAVPPKLAFVLAIQILAILNSTIDTEDNGYNSLEQINADELLGIV
ncbi:DNA cytosine methyltransferase [Sutcliffiella deserti]|uniref:DNA cytosine methyltransferase n=1 Tax=Sutcliffiella deserti TaxID=2875501 RepID=UPI001CBFE652|nr:DNA cytosine methyltransferase [Sutcliffiella deserti]